MSYTARKEIVMLLEDVLAQVRFGYGLSPHHAPISDVAQRIRLLAGPDETAQRYPIAPFDVFREHSMAYRDLARARREAPTREAANAARMASREYRAELHRDALRVLARTVARALDAPDPFRERLVRFWADHFTVLGKHAVLRWAAPHYVEDAIRPFIAGRFADLLASAVLHPMMLAYLDQDRSVGPNSRMSQRNPGRGLNENLARELLELHTLGVGGAYTQDDVRQLAELLAGLSVRERVQMHFAPNRGEPGPETVLGKTYGRRSPSLEDIYAVLEDLAAHRDTARHLARKLAVHFVSDTPPPDLVKALARAYRQSGGDLLEVYAVLRAHPASQDPTLHKAKRPYDLVVSAFRGLGVEGATTEGFKLRETGHMLRIPLHAMGQTWLRPPGPDGWPEDASHWITPQGLAARVSWAMGLRDKAAIRLPDPRLLVDQVLGPLASERLRFAARAAETRADGVGVILASPEFNRR